MNKYLQSSMNPDQVSNTVKGFVLALSGVLVLVLNHLGVNITNEDITGLASQLGIVAGSIWFIWGLIMKILMRSKNICLLNE